jgi:EAL domain-containing protein (putative c-di-GMP-specific phosphodiesterase class I)
MLYQESITVGFQPVVEVGTNQVFGYKTLICDSQGGPRTLERYRRDQSAEEAKELNRVFFGVQLQRAQEMGLDRAFINVDTDLLKEVDSMCPPPGMDVVLEVTSLHALGGLQACREIFESGRGRGFQFAVENFGAGFVLLPIIACLSPEYLKFDLSGMAQTVAYEEFREIAEDLMVAVKNYSQKGIYYTP